MFQMATAPNVQGNGLYVIGGYSKGTGELSSLWEFTCPTAGTFFVKSIKILAGKYILIKNSFRCWMPMESSGSTITSSKSKTCGILNQW